MGIIKGAFKLLKGDVTDATKEVAAAAMWIENADKIVDGVADLGKSGLNIGVAAIKHTAAKINEKAEKLNQKTNKE